MSRAIADRSESVWVLTDGRAGNENQCIGLAERLGVEPRIIQISARAPWKALPPRLWGRNLAGLDDASRNLTTPPWPRLLIATGRLSVAPAAAIRRLAGMATFAVQIQDPRVPADWFDLIVVPNHDKRRGRNVETTLGSLHRVGPRRVEDDAVRLAADLEDLPRPITTVLIGGASKAHRFTPADAADLADRLANAVRKSGGGLAITTSRRTPPETAGILDAKLADAPHRVWDAHADQPPEWSRSGENPYFAFLGAADRIVVTDDSVNMVSEACSVGKPVYLARARGGSAKFDRFRAGFIESGLARSFESVLDNWTPPPFDETGRIAEIVRSRLDKAVFQAS